jgi:hypothetical protein
MRMDSLGDMPPGMTRFARSRRAWSRLSTLVARFMASSRSVAVPVCPAQPNSGPSCIGAGAGSKSAGRGVHGARVIPVSESQRTSRIPAFKVRF